MPLVTTMPFYVRLASNEKPRRSERTAWKEQLVSSSLREFCQGISFGLALLVVLFATYWIIATHVASFPDLQSLQNYWFAFH